MPDLPELYEALDEYLDLLLAGKEEVYSERELATKVSALCAAIEVKQSQELHYYLNTDEYTFSEWVPYKEKTQTTETQEEA